MNNMGLLVFRTQKEHDKYFEVFPNSGGIIISPVSLEGFPKEMWSVYSKWKESDEDEKDTCTEFGIFHSLMDAYFYAIAWNNSDMFDIDYDDIHYVGD